VEARPAEVAVTPVAPSDPKAVKRANFDAYLANAASGSVEATNKPIQLFLEVSSRCNLRCKKCGFSWDPSLAKNGRDLSWPILARMEDFFAAAIEVHTFGYGEMFLYPELAPLVTVLKNHGCRTSGITNGMLIRPADVVWLVATGYDQLTFSIDGGTEATMEKLRGASLAKVLHVLELIHQEKERRKSEFPRIVVNFVAQNDNYHELPELARQLAPLSIWFMGVNPLHHFVDTVGDYAWRPCPGRRSTPPSARPARSWSRRARRSSASSTRNSSGRPPRRPKASGSRSTTGTSPSRRSPRSFRPSWRRRRRSRRPGSPRPFPRPSRRPSR
jgi:pyruvate-formate lyase-activating enzyme